MSTRARKYVVLVATVLLALGLTRFGRDWSDVEFYAAAAGLIVAIVTVGNFWIEFAPDGAFPQARPSH
jgi:hypothetical protein